MGEEKLGTVLKAEDLSQTNQNSFVSIHDNLLSLVTLKQWDDFCPTTIFVKYVIRQGHSCELWTTNSMFYRWDLCITNAEQVYHLSHSDPCSTAVLHFLESRNFWDYKSSGSWCQLNGFSVPSFSGKPHSISFYLLVSQPYGGWESANHSLQSESGQQLFLPISSQCITTMSIDFQSSLQLFSHCKL